MFVARSNVKRGESYLDVLLRHMFDILYTMIIVLLAVCCIKPLVILISAVLFCFCRVISVNYHAYKPDLCSSMHTHTERKWHLYNDIKKIKYQISVLNCLLLNAMTFE